MKRRAVAAVWLLLTPAAAAQSIDAADGASCLAAAARAEVEWSLPAGVLAAIGRVESGRWDPGTRRVEPWPWTANVAGDGRYYASISDAVANVAREQAGGVRSVDVGCFQVNLMHHPNAFANLNEAFDPLANARYAARFLTALRSNAGAWNLAIGQYHSAVPQSGDPYRERVMAVLGQNPTNPSLWSDNALGSQVRLAPTSARVLRGPAALPSPGRPATNSDPYVIVIRPFLTFARSLRRDRPADPHMIRIRG